VFVSALAASGFGALVGMSLGEGALLAIGAPYLAANLAASLAAAWRRRSLKLALLLPLTFASLHLSYGAGSVWGALRLLLALPGTKLRWRPRTV
jgi:hypothetical protein